MARGDVVWVNLVNPPDRGHEQAGHRPAVILGDLQSLSVVTIVPFTTSQAARRFPAVLKIQASRQNGLPQDSFALVFQIQTVDRRRVTLPEMGTLEPELLEAIDQCVVEYCAESQR